MEFNSRNTGSLAPKVTGKSWFLAQLRPNSHRIAERNLQRQGFKTFLPLEERTSRRGSQFRTQLEPIFPGYLFVAFALDDGGWGVIDSTRGIRRLVSFGAGPAPVPFEIVEALKTRTDEKGLLKAVGELRNGDRVAITRGPMAGFTATIESIEPNKRVSLLFDVMRSARVELNAHDMHVL